MLLQTSRNINITVSYMGSELTPEMGVGKGTSVEHYDILNLKL